VLMDVSIGGMSKRMQKKSSDYELISDVGVNLWAYFGSKIQSRRFAFWLKKLISNY
jgi:hypothetical protein